MFGVESFLFGFQGVVKDFGVGKRIECGDYYVGARIAPPGRV